MLGLGVLLMGVAALLHVLLQALEHGPDVVRHAWRAWRG